MLISWGYLVDMDGHCMVYIVGFFYIWLYTLHCS